VHAAYIYTYIPTGACSRDIYIRDGIYNLGGCELNPRKVSFLGLTSHRKLCRHPGVIIIIDRLHIKYIDGDDDTRRVYYIQVTPGKSHPPSMH